MNIRSLTRVAPALVVLCAVVFGAVLPLTLGIPIGTAQVGVQYSSTVAASGGFPPYSYQVTAGALPPGLTLNQSTGAITGIPTTVGNYTFTINVTDSNNPTSSVPAAVGRRGVPLASPPASNASGSFSINVTPQPPLGTPIPPSVLLAGLGLVFAGLYHMFRMRQSA